jgi:hypothetical protein
MSSRAAGRTDATTEVTARPASTTSANVATTVATGGGSGRRRSVASVITPSVPSDPTNSRLRSYPATSLIVRPPRRSARPSARTTSRPST